MAITAQCATCLGDIIPQWHPKHDVILPRLPRSTLLKFTLSLLPKKGTGAFFSDRAAPSREWAGPLQHAESRENQAILLQ